MSVQRPASPSDVKIRLIELSQHVLDYFILTLNSGEFSHRVVAFLIAVILSLVLIYLIANVALKILEFAAHLMYSYRASQYRLSFNAREKKEVLRRQQFASVLAADLSYLDKAESWNDQYYTDLEAEVETDGEYYRSPLHRIFRKKFSGVRKVDSLAKAIESSTERTVLLVGEPGSGKSVALRHLGKQMAERARRSSDPKTPVPLYLNLRELQLSPGEEINSDLIKNFVFENIRRGDSDTSAYVRENWQKNIIEGTWFFLFDSFDEIPSVLHAASESESVKKYSEAIGRFLDAMGKCRGVLASREYKGPQSLTWNKFRILALGPSKQQKLVENSFLSDAEIKIVLQHLAADSSKLGNNPLFLTLLCRHVKELGVPPKNDHELLLQHVKRLSSREPEYINRRYRLTPEQLWKGAEQLAIAFAQDSSLSLAPRLEEIHATLDGTIVSIDELENLILALVDVKIGRNDVANARQGDRRFAFAHRRYQETIFADFLAQNPDHLTPNSLLTQPQWREYAVTLLQSQESKFLQPLLNEACAILDRAAEQQLPCIVDVTDDSLRGYYCWENYHAVDVLNILQEGFVRRMHDFPIYATESIKSFLCPRWDNGDQLDRFMVVRLGGLLPQEVLMTYLGWALKSGINNFEQNAFRQSVFLMEVNKELEKKICGRLATEALSVGSSTKRFRLEAMAAQLPPALNASAIVRRCLRLRPIFSALNIMGWLIFFPNVVIEFLVRTKMLIGGQAGKALSKSVPQLKYRGGGGWVYFFAGLLISYVSYLAVRARAPEASFGDNFRGIPKAIEEFDIVLIGCIIFVALIFAFLYSFRDARSLETYISEVRFDFQKIGSIARLVSFIVVFTLIVAVIPWLLGYGLVWFSNFFGWVFPARDPYFEIGAPAFVVLLLILSIFVILETRRKKKLALQRLEELRSSDSGMLSVLFLAKSFDEAMNWMLYTPGSFLENLTEARTVSAVLLGYSENQNYVSNLTNIENEDFAQSGIFVLNILWLNLFLCYIKEDPQRIVNAYV